MEEISINEFKKLRYKLFSEFKELKKVNEEYTNEQNDNVYGDKINEDIIFDNTAYKFNEYYKYLSLYLKRHIQGDINLNLINSEALINRIISLGFEAEKVRRGSIPDFFWTEVCEEYQNIDNRGLINIIASIKQNRDYTKEAFDLYLKGDKSAMQEKLNKIKENNNNWIFKKGSEKSKELENSLVDAITDENVESVLTLYLYNTLSEEQV